jgi:hypothetical protein
MRVGKALIAMRKLPGRANMPQPINSVFQKTP